MNITLKKLKTNGIPPLVQKNPFALCSQILCYDGPFVYFSRHVACKSNLYRLTFKDVSFEDIKETYYNVSEHYFHAYTLVLIRCEKYKIMNLTWRPESRRKRRSILFSYNLLSSKNLKLFLRGTNGSENTRKWRLHQQGQGGSQNTKIIIVNKDNGYFWAFHTIFISGLNNEFVCVLGGGWGAAGAHMKLLNS